MVHFSSQIVSKIKFKIFTLYSLSATDKLKIQIWNYALPTNNQKNTWKICTYENMDFPVND